LALVLLLPGTALAEISAGDAMLAGLPPEIVRRLQRDGLVVLVTARDPNDATADTSNAVVGFVLFDASLDETYRLLSQTTRQIEYRSELTAIENLEWTNTGPIDQHRIKILFRRFNYHLQFKLDPESRSLRWELDPDYENDLMVVEGSWELFGMDDGRTLGRFTTRVEVGTGVPRFLQDYFTRKNLPSTLGNCRRWVGSDGKYRP